MNEIYRYLFLFKYGCEFRQIHPSQTLMNLQYGESTCAFTFDVSDLERSILRSPIFLRSISRKIAGLDLCYYVIRYYQETIYWDSNDTITLDPG